jgi:excisionase family DNA binding protein
MSNNIAKPEDRLFTPAETAKYLGVSIATLAKWRCLGTQQLPFVRAGRLIRYRLTDVHKYLDSRTQQGRLFSDSGDR